MDALDRLKQFAEREVQEGAVVLHFRPGKGWSFAAEYGREAPDSPMAGAATYGMDDDPRACIEEALSDAGYGEGGRRVREEA
jgi:hypothetical protein